MIQTILWNDSTMCVLFHAPMCTGSYYHKEFKTFITIPSTALKEVNIITKGVPKRDGSGKGVRANKGRGGCIGVRKTGKMSRRR